MASNTQYQGGGMGKKHMPPLVAKPIITVTEFTPGNTPDRVIIFAFFFAFFRNFWPLRYSSAVNDANTYSGLLLVFSRLIELH